LFAKTPKPRMHDLHGPSHKTSMHTPKPQRDESSKPTQEIADLRPNAAWKKGCAAFLIAWKNKVIDLETLRDVDDSVADHERQSWPSRSSLMHNQMRTAPTRQLGGQ
jgi:hypothetical protein